MAAWDAQYGCARKRAYLSKREAKVANLSLSAKERLHGRSETHVYLCPNCRAYHLGHAGSTWAWKGSDE